MTSEHLLSDFKNLRRKMKNPGDGLLWNGDRYRQHLRRVRIMLRHLDRT